MSAFEVQNLTVHIDGAGFCILSLADAGGSSSLSLSIDAAMALRDFFMKVTDCGPLAEMSVSYSSATGKVSKRGGNL